MAFFDLDTESGEKFQYFRSEVQEDGETKYFDPDPDEPCWVTLCMPDPDKLEEMFEDTRTQVVERVLNPKTRSMERLKDFDQTAEQKKQERIITWDNTIKTWEGVLDKHGTVVECTTENKLRMMMIPAFSRFIGRCLQMMSGEVKEAKKVESKNS